MQMYINFTNKKSLNRLISIKTLTFGVRNKMHLFCPSYKMSDCILKNNEVLPPVSEHS